MSQAYLSEIFYGACQMHPYDVNFNDKQKCALFPNLTEFTEAKLRTSKHPSTGIPILRMQNSRPKAVSMGLR
jgi:hypothetical protein